MTKYWAMGLLWNATPSIKEKIRSLNAFWIDAFDGIYFFYLQTWVLKWSFCVFRLNELRELRLWNYLLKFNNYLPVLRYFEEDRHLLPTKAEFWVCFFQSPILDIIFNAFQGPEQLKGHCSLSPAFTRSWVKENPVFVWIRCLIFNTFLWICRQLV